ncbi:MAG: ATP-binding cassette domain-containing protein [Eggerthellaceae bacterium]|nr:ATP-binding cassette domain-containing protein [Eggerthellaceae bacterium]
MSLEVDIRKRYGSFQLDVAFQAGDETFGLLGASGCGKSLTMRCIAGIDTPDEGRIVVNGTTFFDSAQGINLSPQKRKTALLFQSYMLFPNLTVEQNVAAGVDRSLPPEERARIVEAELVRFDVIAFAKRYPSQLSGGQQQRVALARMLAARPGILMLDEPFSALDAHLKTLLEQSLVGLFDSFDGTIIYVSHDIDEALHFCDRIAVVEAGHIMEIDKGRELIDDPKSLAGIKLSGCKNALSCERVSPTRLFCPSWGIEIDAMRPIPSDIKAFGVRAFRLERASEPGPNVYRVRVDRVSDSRYDRSALLCFLDREEGAQELVGENQEEMRYLHQRLFWRVDTLKEPRDSWPELGEELLIRIPPESLYLVSR